MKIYKNKIYKNILYRKVLSFLIVLFVAFWGIVFAQFDPGYTTDNNNSQCSGNNCNTKTKPAPTPAPAPTTDNNTTPTTPKCDYIDFLLNQYVYGGNRNGCGYYNTNNSNDYGYTVIPGNTSDGTSGGSYNFIRKDITNPNAPVYKPTTYTVISTTTGNGTSGGSYNFINTNATSTPYKPGGYTVSTSTIGNGTSGGSYNFIKDNIIPNNSNNNNNNNNNNNTIQIPFSLGTKDVISNSCEQITCYGEFSAPSSGSALVFFQLLDDQGRVLSESGKVDLTGRSGITFSNTFTGLTAANYSCRSLVMINGQVMNGNIKTASTKSCAVTKTVTESYTRNDK